MAYFFRRFLACKCSGGKYICTTILVYRCMTVVVKVMLNMMMMMTIMMMIRPTIALHMGMINKMEQVES